MKSYRLVPKLNLIFIANPFFKGFIFTLFLVTRFNTPSYWQTILSCFNWNLHRSSCRLTRIICNIVLRIIIWISPPTTMSRGTRLIRKHVSLLRNSCWRSITHTLRTLPHYATRVIIRSINVLNARTKGTSRHIASIFGIY